MTQSSREIKRRISSISSTQQITKAMEMIAAAKLLKAQQTVLNSRPYYARLTEILRQALEAVSAAGAELPKILQDRRSERHCLVVVTSDRGLAGGYNALVIRRAEAFLREHAQTEMVIVGRKARDYFRRRGQTFLAEYLGLGDEPQVRQAAQIGQVIFDFYEHRLFDRVSILYTKFINTVTHQLTLRPVLPLEQALPQTKPAGLRPVYIYEPSLNVVLERLLPQSIQAAVYQSLVEAKASELGARMAAMHSATDNAGELIRELNLSYNRARQAQITKEIAEIVGGADALQS